MWADVDALLDLQNIFQTGLVVGATEWSVTEPMAHAAFDQARTMIYQAGFQISPELFNYDNVVGVMKVSLLLLAIKGGKDAWDLFWTARRADGFKERLAQALAEKES